MLYTYYFATSYGVCVSHESALKSSIKHHGERMLLPEVLQAASIHLSCLINL